MEVAVEGAVLPEGESTSTAAVDGAASSIIMTACLRFTPTGKSASGVGIGVMAGMRNTFSEEARGNEADDANGVETVSEMSLRTLGRRALVTRELTFVMVGLAGVKVGDGDGG